MKKLFTIIFILFSTNAFSYLVKGNHECGDIINGNKTDNNMLLQAVSSWIQGYITARNFVNASENGKGVSFHSLYYAVLNFCEDNPLKDLDDAAIFIYSQFEN